MYYLRLLPSDCARAGDISQAVLKSIPRPLVFPGKAVVRAITDSDIFEGELESAF